MINIKKSIIYGTVQRIYSIENVNDLHQNYHREATMYSSIYFEFSHLYKIREHLKMFSF